MMVAANTTHNYACRTNLYNSALAKFLLVGVAACWWSSSAHRSVGNQVVAVASSVEGRSTLKCESNWFYFRVIVAYQ